MIIFKRFFITFIGFCILSSLHAVKEVAALPDDLQQKFKQVLIQFPDAARMKSFKLHHRGHPDYRDFTTDEFASLQIQHYYRYLTEDYVQVWREYHPVKKEGMSPAYQAQKAYLCWAFATTRLASLLGEKGYTPLGIHLDTFRDLILAGLESIVSGSNRPQGFFASFNDWLIQREDRALYDYIRHAWTYKGILLGDVYQQTLYPMAERPFKDSWDSFTEAERANKDERFGNINFKKNKKFLIFKARLITLGYLPEGKDSPTAWKIAKDLLAKYDGRKRAQGAATAEEGEYNEEEMDELQKLLDHEDGNREEDEEAQEQNPLAAPAPAVENELNFEKEEAQSNDPHKGQAFNRMLADLRDTLAEEPQPAAAPLIEGVEEPEPAAAPLIEGVEEHGDGEDGSDHSSENGEAEELEGPQPMEQDDDEEGMPNSLKRKKNHRMIESDSEEEGDKAPDKLGHEEPEEGRPMSQVKKHKVIKSDQENDSGVPRERAPMGTNDSIVQYIKTNFQALRERAQELFRLGGDYGALQKLIEDQSNRQFSCKKTAKTILGDYFSQARPKKIEEFFGYIEANERKICRDIERQLHEKKSSREPLFLEDIAHHVVDSFSLLLTPEVKEKCLQGVYALMGKNDLLGKSSLSLGRFLERYTKEVQDIVSAVYTKSVEKDPNSLWDNLKKAIEEFAETKQIPYKFKTKKGAQAYFYWHLKDLKKSETHMRGPSEMRNTLEDLRSTHWIKKFLLKDARLLDPTNKTTTTEWRELVENFERYLSQMMEADCYFVGLEPGKDALKKLYSQYIQKAGDRYVLKPQETLSEVCKRVKQKRTFSNPKGEGMGHDPSAAQAAQEDSSPHKKAIQKKPAKNVARHPELEKIITFIEEKELEFKESQFGKLLEALDYLKEEGLEEMVAKKCWEDTPARKAVWNYFKRKGFLQVQRVFRKDRSFSVSPEAKKFLLESKRTWKPKEACEAVAHLVGDDIAITTDFQTSMKSFLTGQKLNTPSTQKAEIVITEEAKKELGEKVETIESAFKKLRAAGLVPEKFLGTAALTNYYKNKLRGYMQNKNILKLMS